MLASAIKMTCYGFLPVFHCGIICRLRLDSYIKAGICTLFSTVAYYFSGHIVNYLFDLSENYYEIDFHNWEQYTGDNILFIILLLLLFVSAVLISMGVYRSWKSRK